MRLHSFSSHQTPSILIPGKYKDKLKPALERIANRTKREPYAQLAKAIQEFALAKHPPSKKFYEHLKVKSLQEALDKFGLKREELGEHGLRRFYHLMRSPWHFIKALHRFYKKGFNITKDWINDQYASLPAQMEELEKLTGWDIHSFQDNPVRKQGMQDTIDNIRLHIDDLPRHLSHLPEDSTLLLGSGQILMPWYPRENLQGSLKLDVNHLKMGEWRAPLYFLFLRERKEQYPHLLPIGGLTDSIIVQLSPEIWSGNETVQSIAKKNNLNSLYLGVCHPWGLVYGDRMTKTMGHIQKNPSGSQTVHLPLDVHAPGAMTPHLINNLNNRQKRHMLKVHLTDHQAKMYWRALARYSHSQLSLEGERRHVIIPARPTHQLRAPVWAGPQ